MTRTGLMRVIDAAEQLGIGVYRLRQLIKSGAPSLDCGQELDGQYWMVVGCGKFPVETGQGASADRPHCQLSMEPSNDVGPVLVECSWHSSSCSKEGNMKYTVVIQTIGRVRFVGKPVRFAPAGVRRPVCRSPRVEEKGYYAVQDVGKTFAYSEREQEASVRRSGEALTS